MLFSAFPDDARLWVYAADRDLTAEERQTLTASLASFTAGWTSHQRPVDGEVMVLHDRFLVLAARIAAGGDISGCGIDKSVHAVEALATSLGFQWLPALAVLYEAPDGAVQAVARPAFRRLVREGQVDAQTPVFDPSLDTVGALRHQGIRRQAGASWHGRVFRIQQPV